MDLFLGGTILLVAVLVYVFYTHSSHWYLHAKWVPFVAFVVCARAYDMNPYGWQNAFVLAGFTAIFFLLATWKQNMIYDRVMLGINLFFVIGAYGFISGNSGILEWYGATKGGPLFGSILLVGLLATLCTKEGFIGTTRKKNQSGQYASVLLFAATVIALIWSVRMDAQGVVISIVIPFLLLWFVRDQLIKHVE